MSVNIEWSRGEATRKKIDKHTQKSQQFTWVNAPYKRIELFFIGSIWFIKWRHRALLHDVRANERAERKVLGKLQIDSPCEP